MKYLKPTMLLALVLSLSAVITVFAQDDTLVLSLSRDWGYGGFAGDIQGTFTMKASGPATLVKVEFFIDETKIGQANTMPFNLQFVTDNYPAGNHALYAIGTTTNGTTLTSKKIIATFLSKDASNKAIFGTIGPILAIVFGAIIVSTLIPLLTARQTVQLERGAARQYGFNGGGVCPNCKRPFVFHFYGLKLILFKFDRCPYCGKWSLVRRASTAELRQAEAAELEGSQAQIPQRAADEILKKELDDSKYQSL